jgi:hypothetical protein
VATPHLAVARLHGHGEVLLPDEPRLRALTVVEGTVELLCRDGFALVVPAGRTAALPAAMGEATARLARAHAVLSAVA